MLQWQFWIAAVAYIAAIQWLLRRFKGQTFIREYYIVHKRYRLHWGMTIGAVGYSTNFESSQLPTAQIHRNNRIACKNEREKKIPLASKSGAHICRVDPWKEPRPKNLALLSLYCYVELQCPNKTILDLQFRHLILKMSFLVFRIICIL